MHWNTIMALPTPRLSIACTANEITEQLQVQLWMSGYITLSLNEVRALCYDSGLPTQP